MPYKHIYNLLNNVYNYNFKNQLINEEYNNLYETIMLTNIDDINTNIIIKSFHIKNLALQGISFNNIHLQTNSKLYYNFLNCLIERERHNTKIKHKPINLFLYYNVNTFNLEEFYKLEIFNPLINKKIIYVYEYDIINDLYHYLNEKNNFEIVYIIKNKCELCGCKQHIQIEFNDSNVQNMKNYFELIQKMKNTTKVYTIINSKKCNIINEYFSTLQEMKSLYPNLTILDKSFLLGEHLGIDEDNNFYMKLNTEKFYQTKEKTFQDYYIEYNTLSEPCLNCNECIYCITNTSDKRCSYKLL